MMHFLKGGNWDAGTYAGHLYFDLQTYEIKREIFGWPKKDLEGLSDRWLKIISGETGWTKCRTSHF